MIPIPKSNTAFVLTVKELKNRELKNKRRIKSKVTLH